MIYAYDKKIEKSVHVRSSLNQETKRLLSNTFTYIGRGKHCFCFKAQNEPIVIKFHKYKPPLHQNWWFISPFFYVKKGAKKEKQILVEKQNELFDSYIKALSVLKEESGLIDGSFLPDPFSVKIYDKNQHLHLIQLQNTFFFIQKKGELCFESLERWYKQGEVELAKQGINSLVELLTHIYQKGYSHEDCILGKNVGFLGTKAFFIDIGDYKELSPSQKEEGINAFLAAKTGELETFLKDKKELYSWYKALIQSD